MSAHYTKSGLPPFPTASGADGAERWAFLPAGQVRALRSYGQACYDTGRADHIAEVGQMAPLTHEQTKEIKLRFTSLNRGELVRAVIRATENAHGIATPKEQTL